ncbi:MAG TPA: hypothetical protein VGM02_01990 [Acidobacteriaceae bacterium]
MIDERRRSGRFVILTAAGRVGSSRMHWLFAVFVVSLCALLWAAIAVARHIRRDRKELRAAETEVKQDNL